MPLVQQFEQLWDTATVPPDVFTFLKQQPVDSQQWLAVLLADQQRRWSTDSPWKVEDYLVGLPELPGNVDWKLQLAIGEFEARRDTDRPLSAQEISSRFPELGDTLRDRMQDVTLEHLSSARQSDKEADDSAIDPAEIDRICDAFEAAWGKGDETPQIEDFLNRTTSAARETLLMELIQVELWWRKQRGEVPTAADYISRFPEQASRIQELLIGTAAHSRRQSRSAIDPSIDPIAPTAFMPQHGPKSTVTFITSTGIGVQQKGRYRLDRILGEGAFGRVYLGFDEELHRQVAIKVPTKARFKKPEDAEAYLAEARTVASLDHPNIVSVYDMGRTEDGSIYVVSKFIEGSTLEQRIKTGLLGERESTQLLATVALALQHAHDRRLIHRDVKPANILLEGKSNAPYVADFGLAVREEDYLKQNSVAGTPAYMSPEQIRGEGHRLDGRSDIFSLGVILYELLTGKKPFRGSSLQETLHLVLTAEPRPPRELLASIPAELERISLKALSKRVSDRYATAAQFADDLQQWLKPAAAVTEVTTTVQVVPKGLRSFDAADADFFLELLPGQRNRDGLPESIAFWKQRIEQTDPEQTFSVGLIYGPSGCGKSSLVKAGLLPHLSDSVIAVYVEATPEDTETRVLRGLRKRLPELSEDLGLAETLAAMRRGQGNKVVIIIDQFEQWLHAHRAEADAELVKALRQCDGGRVQAILMVRDDFVVAVARLMSVLDIPILQGQNFTMVDLFDVDHAAKVLTKFGQAFGKLPSNTANLSPDEQQFVAVVADGLAQDGKVVSVRLSLFAEMVKSKPWTTTTLNQVGGTDGIGVNFLEETFSSQRANPRHRLHAVAARGVLQALLPGLDTDIKGGMRSQTELMEASGYQDRPADFADLLRILDGELRLITPTDPEGRDSQSKSDLQSQYYQLTHDYLVPSLREWLTRKQKETRKGRAELKLAERSSLWHAKPENRYLPSLVEWFSIRTLTDRKRWNSPQQSLMQRATRVHGSRMALGLAASVLLLLGGLWTKSRVDEGQAKTSASGLVAALLSAETRDVPKLVSGLTLYRQWADPELQTALESTDTKTQLHARIALLPVDASQVEPLQNALLDTTPENVLVLREVLQASGDQIAESYWPILQSPDTANQRRLSAGAALARFAPDDDRWTKVAGPVSDLLVSENPLRLATWIEALRPAASFLKPELSRIYATSSTSRPQTEIDLATEILDAFAADDFKLLHEMVLTGQPRQFLKMFDKYAKFRQQAIEELRVELARPFTSDDSTAGAKLSVDEKQALYLAYIERQANAAVALFRLEDPEPVYQFLTVDRDSEALSQFIHRIRGREVSPSLLIKSLYELKNKAVPKDSLQQKQHEYRLYGFLLGLGEFTAEQMPALQRETLVTELAGLYGTHPSRVVHSALGWLLRRWGQNELVRRVDETPLAYDASGEREWYIVKIDPPRRQPLEADSASVVSGDDESTGTATEESNPREKPVIDLVAPIFFTLIVFPGGEFDMGDPGETKRVRIAGPIAVSDREITWRQFSPFDGDTHRQEWEHQFKRSLGAEDPAFGMSWFEAVNYCRRLSAASGLGELSQSYAKLEFPEGAESDPGWLDLLGNTEWPIRVDRPGFRLLTEAEWEYVARAGTETTYSFGNSESLLGNYCWYMSNSEEWSNRTGLLRPSLGGLFDIDGNLKEWTDDRNGEARVLRGGSYRNDAAGCRSALRGSEVPTIRSGNCGLRLALSPAVRVPAEPGHGKEVEPAGADTVGASAEQRPEMP